MMVVEMKEEVVVEKVNEEDLVENKDLRNKLINRVDTLEKVKNLITLPKTKLLTTKMVMEFYEISYEAINKTLQRNREELLENGMVYMSFKEIKSEIFNQDLKSELDESIELTPKGLGLSPKGSFIFTLRAVLNVGMLLRDSKIAKEVRNQLLNVFDNSTTEQKIQSINEEEGLILNIVRAGTDLAKQAVAIAELNNFQKRHIAELNAAIAEEKVKNEKQAEEINHKDEVIQGIADDISIADKRQILNRIVRKDCPASMHSQRWVYLYKEFGAKHHMNIKARTDKFNESTGNKYSTLDYIDSELGMFNELYELAVKLFSGSVEKLANELYEIAGSKSEY